MSDLLSGLPDYDINPFDLGTMYENPEGGGQYVLKDDVAEVLRHPTDGQVEAVRSALPYWVPFDTVKDVLAAVAGGDDE